jgi:hypothetical protein
LTAITTPAALQCRICGARYNVEPLTICEECFGPLTLLNDGANGRGYRQHDE